MCTRSMKVCIYFASRSRSGFLAVNQWLFLNLVTFFFLCSLSGTIDKRYGDLMRRNCAVKDHELFFQAWNDGWVQAFVHPSASLYDASDGIDLHPVERGVTRGFKPPERFEFRRVYNGSNVPFFSVSPFGLLRPLRMRFPTKKELHGVASPPRVVEAAALLSDHHPAGVSGDEEEGHRLKGKRAQRGGEGGRAQRSDEDITRHSDDDLHRRPGKVIERIEGVEDSKFYEAPSLKPLMEFHSNQQQLWDGVLEEPELPSGNKQTLKAAPVSPIEAHKLSTMKEEEQQHTFLESSLDRSRPIGVGNWTLGDVMPERVPFMVNVPEAKFFELAERENEDPSAPSSRGKIFNYFAEKGMSQQATLSDDFTDFSQVGHPENLQAPIFKGDISIESKIVPKGFQAPRPLERSTVVTMLSNSGWSKRQIDSWGTDRNQIYSYETPGELRRRNYWEYLLALCSKGPKFDFLDDFSDANVEGGSADLHQEEATDELKVTGRMEEETKETARIEVVKEASLDEESEKAASQASSSSALGDSYNALMNDTLTEIVEVQDDEEDFGGLYSGKVVYDRINCDPEMIGFPLPPPLLNQAYSQYHTEWKTMNEAGMKACRNIPTPQRKLEAWRQQLNLAEFYKTPFSYKTSKRHVSFEELKPYLLSEYSKLLVIRDGIVDYSLSRNVYTDKTSEKGGGDDKDDDEVFAGSIWDLPDPSWRTKLMQDLFWIPEYSNYYKTNTQRFHRAQVGKASRKYDNDFPIFDYRKFDFGMAKFTALNQAAIQDAAVIIVRKRGGSGEADKPSSESCLIEENATKKTAPIQVLVVSTSPVEELEDEGVLDGEIEAFGGDLKREKRENGEENDEISGEKRKREKKKDLVSSEYSPWINPRVLIHVGDGACAAVHQSHVNIGDPHVHSGVANSVTRVVLGEGSRLEHSYIQELGRKMWHWENIAVRNGKNANYQYRGVQLGAKSSRVNMQIEGAENCTQNCYSIGFPRYKQDISTYQMFHHDSPGMTTEQRHKLVISDRGMGMWRGRVRIEREGVGASADTLCRAILLNQGARCVTVPTLEIIPKEVKQASHGAAISDLEKEPLFYLMTRGVSLANARFILMEAFTKEVLNDMPEAPSKQRIFKRLRSMVKDIQEGIDREEISA